MDSDMSLEEQIDLMAVSIQRNIVVTVILTSAILFLQGIVIILLAVLLNQAIISIVVGIFGGIVTIVGLISLIPNYRKTSNIVQNMNKIKEDLPDEIE